MREGDRCAAETEPQHQRFPIREIIMQSYFTTRDGQTASREEGTFLSDALTNISVVVLRLKIQNE